MGRRCDQPAYRTITYAYVRLSQSAVRHFEWRRIFCSRCRERILPVTAQAAPETIFNDVMERVRGYLRTRTASEFQLRQVEREIQQLAKVDAAGAFELSACLAAFQDDLDEIDAKYSRALAVTDDFVGTRVRYLNLLCATGQSGKVYEKYREFYSALRSDPAAMRMMEGALSFSGWVKTAFELVKDMQRMGVESAKRTSAEQFDNKGFDESDFALPVGFAQRWLIEKNVPTHTVQSMALPCQDGGTPLLFQLGIERTPEETAELEWELFGALDQAEYPAEKSGALRITLASMRTSSHGHFER